MQNPIAPLVTSLEEARMISSAGTSKDTHKETELSETPIELINLSVPSPHEPSVNLAQSEQTPTEPVSETPPTQTPPPITRAKFEILQQRVADMEVALNQTIDTMKWVRHAHRDMNYDHNAQMAPETKKLDDFIHSQTVQSQSTNTAATTILKDSSTEGEKRAVAGEQEKAGAGDKGKRKASEVVKVTEGEFEEGKIHPD